MSYYSTTEVAKMHGMTAKQLTCALSAKSCIYHNPQNMKQWLMYDSFIEGVDNPYKRYGNSILWSEEMLPIIANVVKRTKKNAKSICKSRAKAKATKKVNAVEKVTKEEPVKVEEKVTNIPTDSWYLRKYFDIHYGDCFQMTRQTKGPGQYAVFNDNQFRYIFNKDCDRRGIRSKGKGKTKLLTNTDANFKKWDNFLQNNRIK